MYDHENMYLKDKTVFDASDASYAADCGRLLGSSI